MFLSALLTTVLGYSIIPITDSTIINQSSWIVRSFGTLWGNILFLLLSFVAFSFAIFGICKCLKILSQCSDNKKTKEQRKRIAKEFYKVIVPDIIAGASLFEKAYEVETNLSKDAMEITLEEKSVGKKATLYYYESFFQFKMIADHIDSLQIIEYKDYDRRPEKELIQLIGHDGLKTAIQLSCHCVTQVCNRIEDAGEAELQKWYEDSLRNLL